MKEGGGPLRTASFRIMKEPGLLPAGILGVQARDGVHFRFGDRAEVFAVHDGDGGYRALVSRVGGVEVAVEHLDGSFLPLAVADLVEPADALAEELELALLLHIIYLVKQRKVIKLVIIYERNLGVIGQKAISASNLLNVFLFWFSL